MVNPRELGLLVLQSLEASGCPTRLYSAPYSRPLLLETYLDGIPVELRVFVWRITGGGASRSGTERRVQTTRPGDQPFLVDGDSWTLLLGFHEESGVFGAWDVRSHPDPGSSSSLQVPIETLEKASVEAVAANLRSLANGDLELVQAFRPNMLGNYLRALGCLRDLSRDPAADEDLASASRGDYESESSDGDSTRQRVLQQVSRFARDSRFRSAVLEAYSGRCAFCGLGLDLPQAAHITPVADDGPDSISNGFALCPTHHLAFDRGLIVVGPDGHIEINDPRCDFLGFELGQRRMLGSSLLEQIIEPDHAFAMPDRSRFEAHREKWS